MTQAKCFKCREPGHFAASCPEVIFAEELAAANDGRPLWCGQCDKRTRTLFDDQADTVTRCPACNPNEDLLPQYRYCRCGNAVYRWDKSECGSHQETGKQLQPEKEKAE